MPNSVYVWIAAIVVLGLIVGLALWRGRGLRIKKGQEGYSLEVDKVQEPDTRTDNITVAEQAELTDVEAGDIAGRKVTSPDAVGDRTQNINVGNRAKIERTKMGDIAGIIQKGSPPPDQNKKE